MPILQGLARSTMFLSFKSVLSAMKSQRLETLDSGAKLYHYTRENTNEKSRIHLRVDPDGTGTLIVNANRVMHLNPTAALMAHLILEGKHGQEILLRVRQRYQVSASRASQDLADFQLQLDNLLRPDGACPIHELDLETVMPFS